MKRILQQGILSFALLVAITGTQAGTTPSQTYTLDPNHSYVSWKINHFGFSNPSGKWMVNGTLMFNEKDPSHSQITVNIPVGQIVTGLPELDQHLKSALFFDVEKFPTATFVSREIRVTGKDTGDITGTLTVHGISKPIVIHARFNKMGVNPINQQNTVGFSGRATVNRKDFGITTLSPQLGDEVKLRMEIEANQPKSSS